MYSVVFITCGFLGLLVLCGAHSHTTETKCVSNFLEFEQKTFINNTDEQIQFVQDLLPSEWPPAIFGGCFLSKCAIKWNKSDHTDSQ